MIPIRLCRALLAVAIAFLGHIALAWAFAEEPLPFRDPTTGQTTDDEISTIHSDLTYALALAAGFSVTDSRELQIWNQLVDSEELGPSDAVSYTNCSGAFAPAPDANAVCRGKLHSQVVWPRWDDMKDSATCTTSRFGPTMPFFHFPHRNAQELGSLHDWGWGLTDQLIGYEAYAWGNVRDVTVMQATCLFTRTTVITTGIPAGSLPAFATYLHSLADSYSHRDCIAAMDSLSMPWSTHTTPPIDESVYACDYHPNNPQPDDVHGREFYTYTDSLRTDAAIQHVYSELVTRSLRREGVYFPISLSTPISGTQTLGDLLDGFVHNWDFTQAESRRALADQLAQSVLTRRLPRSRLYILVAVKMN